MVQLKDLFRAHSGLADQLLQAAYDRPWEILGRIHQEILALQGRLDPQDYLVQGDIWIHKSAKVHPSAVLQGPLILGPEVEVRPHVFIRKDVLAEKGALIGSSCEAKNVLLLEGAQAAHFNYLGDSVLGAAAHLGAGAITSNFRADHGPVPFHDEKGQVHETGLRKFGALVGDEAEVGCNTVLNPGTIVGPGARIYPTSCIRGQVPANTIVKNNGQQVPLR